MFWGKICNRDFCRQVPKAKVALIRPLLSVLKFIEGKGWPFLLDLGSPIVQNYVRKTLSSIWGPKNYMEQKSPCGEAWESHQ